MQNPLPPACFPLLLLPPPLSAGLPVGCSVIDIQPLSFSFSLAFCKSHIPCVWIEWMPAWMEWIPNTQKNEHLTYMCKYMPMNVYICIYIYIYRYIYVGIYVGMYVYIYICVYMYM